MYTLYNVVVRRRRKKTRKNEERMTYNIAESLCVALKLFTKKTTQEHPQCATIVACILLSKISHLLSSFHLRFLSLSLSIMYFIHQMKHEQVHHKIITYIISWHTFNATSDQILSLLLFLSWGWGGFRVRATFYAAVLLLLFLAWIWYCVHTWSSTDDDMMKLVWLMNMSMT